MNDKGNMQNQRWAMLGGILALLFILNKVRQRRKMKKMIEKRLQARIEEKREKSISGKVRRRLVEETKAGKKGRKGKKDKSMLKNLIKAVLFQLAKKMIMEQLNQAETGIKGFQRGKKRAHEAAEVEA
jgi:hypothetical protein